MKTRKEPPAPKRRRQPARKQRREETAHDDTAHDDPQPAQKGRYKRRDMRAER
ncbi:hypothetical protein OKW45_001960 [Paraburkholderia sp. WSM4175]|uniref:hypothetical protein n=1 Tax=Paraburkholderia sp. WSM4175 TaxID=2991072 RepID=UPI003D1A4EE9